MGLILSPPLSFSVELVYMSAGAANWPTPTLSLSALCLELCDELATCPGRNSDLTPRQAPPGLDPPGV